MDSIVSGSESHALAFPVSPLPVSPRFIPFLFCLSDLSFLICLLPTIHPSLPILPAHCSSLLPGSAPKCYPVPLLPRSAQPACAVKAVGRLQARTGTSSGLEITASAPGALSSMRKVGTWQGSWALGVHRGVGQAPAQAVRTISFLVAFHSFLAMELFLLFRVLFHRSLSST